MAQILYYLVLKPFSYLPLSFLYLLSDLLYFGSLLGVAYRQKIVNSNLKLAFPNKTNNERISIKRKFYKHFYDLVAESIRMFSISEEEALKRFKVTNPEFFDQLKNEGKSAILTGGHYQNWELFAVATAPQIGPKLLGIYTPLTNSFFEGRFSKSRSKFGLILVPKKQVKNYFDTYKNEFTVTTFAIDQCPRPNQKIYWTEFLGQKTACHFGAENYARKYEQVAIFGEAVKVSRGHYELTFKLIERYPQECTPGTVIKKATKMLENQILRAPEYWLWTHKRWKLKPDLKK